MAEETRDRIVAAATALCREDPASRPTVRAVAERAGVGASTLRYYFPTQRALFDSVLSSALELKYPDEQIHDSSIPAPERLRACVENLLTPLGEGEQAREFWMQLFAFASTSPGRQVASALTRLDQGTQRRVETWIEVLEEEGVVVRGHRAQRAQFLLIVIDGLAINRAFPSEHSGAREPDILRVAVETALRDW